MSLLHQAYEQRLREAHSNLEGAMIRNGVRNLVLRYQNSPADLLRYLLSPSDTPLLNGLITSVYARITGDSVPMHCFEYGGLGVTAERKGDRQVFDANQLHFARLNGTALQKATLRGDSGYGSEWHDRAGQQSCVSEDALRRSRNFGRTFMYSEISDRTFRDSMNLDYALLYSRFLGTEALQGSVNHEKLQEHVNQIQRLDAIRRDSPAEVERVFPARRKDGPEGARMFPNFVQLYL